MPSSFLDRNQHRTQDTRCSGDRSNDAYDTSHRWPTTPYTQALVPGAPVRLLGQSLKQVELCCERTLLEGALGGQRRAQLSTEECYTLSITAINAQPSYALPSSSHVASSQEERPGQEIRHIHKSTIRQGYSGTSGRHTSRMARSAAASYGGCRRKWKPGFFLYSGLSTCQTLGDAITVFSPSLRDFACMGHRDLHRALNRINNNKPIISESASKICIYFAS